MGVVLLSAAALPWLFPIGLLGEREDRSKWPNVQGTIQDSKLDCSPCYTTQGGGPEWYLEVEFDYEIKGLRYSGEQNWHVASGSWGIPKEARAEKNRFLPGATLPASSSGMAKLYCPSMAATMATLATGPSRNSPDSIHSDVSFVSDVYVTVSARIISIMPKRLTFRLPMFEYKAWAGHRIDDYIVGCLSKALR